MVTKNKTYDLSRISPWYARTSLQSPLLRDSLIETETPIRLIELELYFNDVYHLLNRTLLKLTYEPDISPHDEQKIEHLVDELIKVKKMLCEMSTTQHEM